MKTTKDRIEEIKNYGYDIDFSDIFNKSFENYKKIALNAGLVFILFSIVMFALIMGIAVAVVGVGALTETLADFKPENFSGIGILIYIVVVVLITALATPFSAGILKMANLAANNREFSIGTAFEYYSGSYFRELFIASAIIAFVGVGIGTIIESLGVLIVGSLVTYIISFFSFLTIPLIIFGNLKALDAIQGSIIIVSKQILVLLGLLIVSYIIVLLGLIGFCIGIIFTIPFIFSMYYTIYDHVMGVDRQSELDEIGTDFE